MGLLVTANRQVDLRLSSYSNAKMMTLIIFKKFDVVVHKSKNKFKSNVKTCGKGIHRLGKARSLDLNVKEVAYERLNKI